MRFSKSLQYAMLLVLYLSRSGRARLADVATSLNLSLSFLRSIANDLRRGRVINSVMGPGGGYEINGDPAVRDIFGALNITLFLTGRESYLYSKGAPEHRALAQTVHSLSLALAPIMRTKVRTLNTNLATSELDTLDRLTDFAQVN